MDRTARLWRTDGQAVATFRSHTGPVVSAVFSPDGRRVLTASGDGTARQFFIDTSELLAVAAQRVGRELSPEEIERFLVPKPLRFRFTGFGGEAMILSEGAI